MAECALVRRHGQELMLHLGIALVEVAHRVTSGNPDEEEGQLAGILMTLLGDSPEVLEAQLLRAVTRI